MKFKDNVIRFMGGRYGGDQLNTAMLVFSIILILVNSFAHSVLFYAITLAVMIWSMYRSMSRKIYDRRRENERFLGIWGKVKSKLMLVRRMWNDRRTHVYRTCPSCKKTLRLPKQKGRHTVCCPCCHNDFNCKVH